LLPLAHKPNIIKSKTDALLQNGRTTNNLLRLDDSSQKEVFFSIQHANIKHHALLFSACSRATGGCTSAGFPAPPLLCHEIKPVNSTDKWPFNRLRLSPNVLPFATNQLRLLCCDIH
jgi:hypothetical protein